MLVTFYSGVADGEAAGGSSAMYHWLLIVLAIYTGQSLVAESMDWAEDDRRVLVQRIAKLWAMLYGFRELVWAFAMSSICANKRTLSPTLRAVTDVVYLTRNHSDWIGPTTSARVIRSRRA